MAATATQNMAHIARSDRNKTPKSSSDSSAALSTTQKDTAQYIADMILELRNMAKSARLHTVMVPLEYAYYEAFSAANRVHVPPEEVERINLLARTVENMEGPAVEDDY